jgi:hypothetical protein
MKSIIKKFSELNESKNEIDKSGFFVDIVKISVKDNQRDVYPYLVNIYYKGILLDTQYQHVFHVKTVNTIDDVVRIISHYSSRDGKFQCNLIPILAKENNLKYNYSENTQDMYVDDHGTLKKV